MKHLIFILSFSVMAVGYLPLAAQEGDREDAFEYDLYDRMRSDKEFSDYDYPDPKKQRARPYYPSCPNCPRNGGNYYYYPNNGYQR